jgi:hypothetical protein
MEAENELLGGLNGKPQVIQKPLVVLTEQRAAAKAIHLGH